MPALFGSEPTQACDQSVPEHVAILDDFGRVVAFNEAWQRCAERLGLRFNVGENYVQACDDAFGSSTEQGSALAAGIRAVIRGALPEFSAVLPTGDPDQQQRLRVRVHRVAGEGSDKIVVTQALVEAGHHGRDTHESVSCNRNDVPAYHVEFAARETADQPSISCHSLLQKVGREMRTPLNAVIGFSHLLLKEPLAERQLQKVRYVHEAGRTLLELVNNLLEYANLDQGDFELRLQAFDVRNLVQEVVTLLQPAANEKLLPVRFVVANEVPTVVIGDRDRLRHVLVNLLNSAVKFTLRGHVLVDVSLADGDAKQVRLKFRVSDTGVGMTPDRQEQVFANVPPASVEFGHWHEGTEIGLALSRRLIARMGGKLDLSSEPGKGTTFEFDPVFLRTTISDGSSVEAPRNGSPLSTDGSLAGDAAVTTAEQATCCGELEELGQAVLDQNWEVIERICSAMIEGEGCRPIAAVSEQAFRLAMAARRRSSPRAREIFRALARAVAESQGMPPNEA